MSVSGVEGVGSGVPVDANSATQKSDRKDAAPAGDGSAPSTRVAGLEWMTNDELDKWLGLVVQDMCNQCAGQSRKSIERQKERRKETESS